MFVYPVSGNRIPKSEMKITPEQREALAILAEIAGDDFYLRGEEIRLQGEAKTAREMAARACGMIHRDGQLLSRLPLSLQLRDRHVVPSECLINSLG